MAFSKKIIMIIGAHVWPLSFLYHIIWIILLENVKCMFYVPLKTLQRTDILVGQVVNTSFLGWLKLILCTVMYAVIFNLISSIVDRYMFGKLLALEVSRANENWPRRWWMAHKGVLQGVPAKRRPFAKKNPNLIDRWSRLR